MRAVWESAAGAWEDYDVDAVGERGPGSSGSISWWSSISPGALTLGAR